MSLIPVPSSLLLSARDTSSSPSPTSAAKASSSDDSEVLSLLLRTSAAWLSEVDFLIRQHCVPPSNSASSLSDSSAINLLAPTLYTVPPSLQAPSVPTSPQLPVLLPALFTKLLHHHCIPVWKRRELIYEVAIKLRRCEQFSLSAHWFELFVQQGPLPHLAQHLPPPQQFTFPTHIKPEEVQTTLDALLQMTICRISHLLFFPSSTSPSPPAALTRTLVNCDEVLSMLPTLQVIGSHHIQLNISAVKPLQYYHRLLHYLLSHAPRSSLLPHWTFLYITLQSTLELLDVKHLSWRMEVSKEWASILSVDHPSCLPSLNVLHRSLVSLSDVLSYLEMDPPLDAATHNLILQHRLALGAETIKYKWRRGEVSEQDIQERLSNEFSTDLQPLLFLLAILSSSTRAFEAFTHVWQKEIARQQHDAAQASVSELEQTRAELETHRDESGKKRGKDKSDAASSRSKKSARNAPTDTAAPPVATARTGDEFIDERVKFLVTRLLDITERMLDTHVPASYLSSLALGGVPVNTLQSLVQQPKGAWLPLNLLLDIGRTAFREGGAAAYLRWEHMIGTPLLDPEFQLYGHLSRLIIMHCNEEDDTDEFKDTLASIAAVLASLSSNSDTSAGSSLIDTASDLLTDVVLFVWFEILQPLLQHKRNGQWYPLRRESNDWLQRQENELIKAGGSVDHNAVWYYDPVHVKFMPVLLTLMRDLQYNDIVLYLRILVEYIEIQSSSIPSLTPSAAAMEPAEEKVELTALLSAIQAALPHLERYRHTLASLPSPSLWPLSAEPLHSIHGTQSRNEMDIISQNVVWTHGSLLFMASRIQIRLGVLAYHSRLKKKHAKETAELEKKYSLTATYRKEMPALILPPYSNKVESDLLAAAGADPYMRAIHLINFVYFRTVKEQQVAAFEAARQAIDQLQDGERKMIEACGFKTLPNSQLKYSYSPSIPSAGSRLPSPLIISRTATTITLLPRVPEAYRQKHNIDGIILYGKADSTGVDVSMTNIEFWPCGVVLPLDQPVTVYGLQPGASYVWACVGSSAHKAIEPIGKTSIPVVPLFPISLRQMWGELAHAARTLGDFSLKRVGREIKGQGTILDVDGSVKFNFANIVSQCIPHIFSNFLHVLPTAGPSKFDVTFDPYFLGPAPSSFLHRSDVLQLTLPLLEKVAFPFLSMLAQSFHYMADLAYLQAPSGVPLSISQLHLYRVVNPLMLALELESIADSRRAMQTIQRIYNAIVPFLSSGSFTSEFDLEPVLFTLHKHLDGMKSKVPFDVVPSEVLRMGYRVLYHLLVRYYNIDPSFGNELLGREHSLRKKVVDAATVKYEGELTRWKGIKLKQDETLKQQKEETERREKEIEAEKVRREKEAKNKKKDVKPKSNSKKKKDSEEEKEHDSRDSSRESSPSPAPVSQSDLPLPLVFPPLPPIPPMPTPNQFYPNIDEEESLILYALENKVYFSLGEKMALVQVGVREREPVEEGKKKDKGDKKDKEKTEQRDDEITLRLAYDVAFWSSFHSSPLSAVFDSLISSPHHPQFLKYASRLCKVAVERGDMTLVKSWLERIDQPSLNDNRLLTPEQDEVIAAAVLAAAPKVDVPPPSPTTGRKKDKDKDRVTSASKEREKEKKKRGEVEPVVQLPKYTRAQLSYLCDLELIRAQVATWDIVEMKAPAANTSSALAPLGPEWVIQRSSKLKPSTAAAPTHAKIELALPPIASMGSPRDRDRSPGRLGVNSLITARTGRSARERSTGRSNSQGVDASPRRGNKSARNDPSPAANSSLVDTSTLYAQRMLHVARAVHFAHMARGWIQIQNCVRFLQNTWAEDKITPGELAIKFKQMGMINDRLMSNFIVQPSETNPDPAPLPFASIAGLAPFIDSITLSTPLKILVMISRRVLDWISRIRNADDCIDGSNFQKLPQVLLSQYEIFNDQAPLSIHNIHDLGFLHIPDLHMNALARFLTWNFETLFHMKEWKLLLDLSMNFHSQTHNAYCSSSLLFMVYAQEELRHDSKRLMEHTAEDIQSIDEQIARERQECEARKEQKRSNRAKREEDDKLQIILEKYFTEKAPLQLQFNTLSAEFQREDTLLNHLRELATLITKEEPLYSHALQHARWKLIDYYSHLVSTNPSGTDLMSIDESHSTERPVSRGGSIGAVSEDSEDNKSVSSITSMGSAQPGTQAYQNRLIIKKQKKMREKTLNSIAQSYNKVISHLRTSPNATILARVLLELGDFYYISEFKREEASVCWSDALDVIFSSLNSVSARQQLLPAPSPASRREFVNKIGVWNCVQGFLSVAKLAKYKYAQNNDQYMKTECCLFAVNFITSLFSLSLAHPSFPHAFASYSCTSLLPGVDNELWASDPLRLRIGHLLDGLEYVARTIMQTQATVLIDLLPLLTFYEYIAMYVCSSLFHVLNARVLKAEVCVRLGYLSEASELYRRVVQPSPDELPLQGTTGVRFGTVDNNKQNETITNKKETKEKEKERKKREEKEKESSVAIDPKLRFFSCYSPSHPMNSSYLSFLLSDPPASLAQLYNGYIYNEIRMLRALLLSTLAERKWPDEHQTTDVALVAKRSTSRKDRKKKEGDRPTSPASSKEKERDVSHSTQDDANLRVSLLKAAEKVYTDTVSVFMPSEVPVPVDDKKAKRKTAKSANSGGVDELMKGLSLASPSRLLEKELGGMDPNNIILLNALTNNTSVSVVSIVSECLHRLSHVRNQLGLTSDAIVTAKKAMKLVQDHHVELAQVPAPSPAASTVSSPLSSARRPASPSISSSRSQSKSNSGSLASITRERTEKMVAQLREGESAPSTSKLTGLLNISNNAAHPLHWRQSLPSTLWLDLRITIAKLYAQQCQFAKSSLQCNTLREELVFVHAPVHQYILLHTEATLLQSEGKYVESYKKYAELYRRFINPSVASKSDDRPDADFFIRFDLGAALMDWWCLVSTKFTNKVEEFTSKGILQLVQTALRNIQSEHGLLDSDVLLAHSQLKSAANQSALQSGCTLPAMKSLYHTRLVKAMIRINYILSVEQYKLHQYQAALDSMLLAEYWFALLPYPLPLWQIEFDVWIGKISFRLLHTADFIALQDEYVTPASTAPTPSPTQVRASSASRASRSPSPSQSSREITEKEGKKKKKNEDTPIVEPADKYNSYDESCSALPVDWDRVWLPLEPVSLAPRGLAQIITRLHHALQLALQHCYDHIRVRNIIWELIELHYECSNSVQSRNKHNSSPLSATSLNHHTYHEFSIAYLLDLAGQLSIAWNKMQFHIDDMLCGTPLNNVDSLPSSIVSEVLEGKQWKELRKQKELSYLQQQVDSSVSLDEIKGKAGKDLMSPNAKKKETDDQSGDSPQLSAALLFHFFLALKKDQTFRYAESPLTALDSRNEVMCAELHSYFLAHSLSYVEHILVNFDVPLTLWRGEGIALIQSHVNDLCQTNLIAAQWRHSTPSVLHGYLMLANQYHLDVSVSQPPTATSNASTAKSPKKEKASKLSILSKSSSNKKKEKKEEGNIVKVEATSPYTIWKVEVEAQKLQELCVLAGTIRHSLTSTTPSVTTATSLPLHFFNLIQSFQALINQQFVKKDDEQIKVENIESLLFQYNIDFNLQLNEDLIVIFESLLDSSVENGGCVRTPCAPLCALLHSLVPSHIQRNNKAEYEINKLQQEQQAIQSAKDSQRSRPTSSSKKKKSS